MNKNEVGGYDICMVEQTEKCPRCGSVCHAEWVDIGFGPFSCQAGPFHCENCGWVESGCPQEGCLPEKCISYNYCKGKAIGPGLDIKGGVIND